MTPTVATEGASRLTVGDVECKMLKDVHFSALRRTFNIPDDFLDGTCDFGKLSGGGGKGGDRMSRTTDSKFFIKELNRGTLNRCCVMISSRLMWTASLRYADAPFV